MAVSANSKLQSVADMVREARAKPGALTFASAGQGSLGHLAFELIQLSAGIKLVHIPYKGASPALIDLLGGRGDLIILAQPALMGHIRSGKMRALAILTASRAADLPNLPTLSESGFPGIESSNWFALMVRAGTPERIIARLNSELNRALEEKDLRAKYVQEGAIPLGGSAQRLGEQIKVDLAKWKRVVTEAGIKIQ
jgi:tripartite-type tricarboxylate transporter receptor subunit TctC